MSGLVSGIHDSRITASRTWMAGLVPAIHVLDAAIRQSWIPETSPDLTNCYRESGKTIPELIFTSF